MVRRYVLVSLVLAAALGAAAAFACGDNGDANGQPDPTTPDSGPTRIAVGDGGADLILNAALAADEIELARLTGYAEVPCEPEGEATDAALECRGEEEPGDEVAVFRVTRCESGWVRPEIVPDVYRAMLTADSSGGADTEVKETPDDATFTPELVAVYRPDLDATGNAEVPGVEHVAVFRTEDRPDGTHFGAALHLVGGRVVHAEEPCISILQLLFGERVESWELAPGELPRIVP
jgi:hypothetical protein